MADVPCSQDLICQIEGEAPEVQTAARWYGAGTGFYAGACAFAAETSKTQMNVGASERWSTRRILDRAVFLLRGGKDRAAYLDGFLESRAGQIHLRVLSDVKQLSKAV